MDPRKSYMSVEQPLSVDSLLQKDDVWRYNRPQLVALDEREGAMTALSRVRFSCVRRHLYLRTLCNRQRTAFEAAQTELELRLDRQESQWKEETDLLRNAVSSLETQLITMEKRMKKLEAAQRQQRQ